LNAPDEKSPGPIASALLLAPLALAPIYLHAPLAVASGLETGPLQSLSSWSLALDRALGGPFPLWTLGASAALHLTGVFLFLFFLRSLGAGGGRALWITALYAVHPLGVPGIVWSGGRAALLANGLALIALNAHVLWLRRQGSAPFVLTWLAGSLAVAIEPGWIVLPVLLLFVESYALERKDPLRERLAEKLPLFVAGIGALWVSLGSPLLESGFAIREAPGNVAKLLFATLWPVGFTDPGLGSMGSAIGAPGVPGIAGAFLVVGISALCVWRGRRHPHAALAWFWLLCLSLASSVLPSPSWPHVGTEHLAAGGGFFVFLGWPRTTLPRSLGWIVGTVSVVLLAGLAHRRHALWAVPDDILQQAVDDDPENARALQALGIELCASGRLSAAQRLFEAARERHPEHPLAHRELGYISMRRALIKGREFHLPDARAHLEEAARYAPADARTHLLLGEVHQRLGESPAARRSFEVALEQTLASKEWSEGLVRSAMVEYELGDLEAAAGSLRRALEIDPRCHQALSVQGVLAFGRGENDAAKQALLHALEIEPDYYEAHYQLGRVHLAEGDVASAEREFQRALEIGADLDAALYELGELYRRSARQADAVRMYRRTVLANPNHVRANVALARLLLEQGEFREAQERLRVVLGRLNPAHAEARGLMQKVQQALRSQEGRPKGGS
jgi:tetratricopeptide (TPR) repeat protein